MISVQRVYEKNQDGGQRFLVDRLWPRGVKKEELKLAGWLKELAPSTELRRRFAHQPEHWEEFKRHYFAELDGKSEALKPLLEAAQQGDVSLLYAARDERYNNAVALKLYLEDKLR